MTGAGIRNMGWRLHTRADGRTAVVDRKAKPTDDDYIFLTEAEARTALAALYGVRQ
jgi:hypothetical protein